MKFRTKKTLPRQGFFRILAGTISGEPSIAWSILRTFRPGLSPGPESRPWSDSCGSLPSASPILRFRPRPSASFSLHFCFLPRVAVSIVPNVSGDFRNLAQRAVILRRLATSPLLGVDRPLCNGSDIRSTIHFPRRFRVPLPPEGDTR